MDAMMPPPYMIQLCRRLFNYCSDDAVLEKVCADWFHQAVNHCSKIMMRKPGCPKLWDRILKLKKLIFKNSETSLMLGDKIPIQRHPSLLSPTSCEEILEKVTSDYLYYTPRWMNVSKENANLRLLLDTLFYFVVLVLCVVYSARWLMRLKRTEDCKESVGLLSPEEENLIQRDIKRILFETKYLSIVPVTDPQLFLCGFPVMNVKIDIKQSVYIQGILLRGANSKNPADAEIKEVSKKLLNFFQNSGKYRILISVEIDGFKDEDAQKELKTLRPASNIPIQKSGKKIGIRRIA